VIKIEQKKSRKTLRFIFILAVASFLFLPLSSYAAYDYGVGRVRSCGASGEIEGLDFNPTSGGKDVEFVLSNPACISVIGYAYVKTKIDIAIMNNTCRNPGGMRVVPSPILDSVDIIKATAKAAINRDPNCARALGTAVASLSGTLAVIGSIYLIAKNVYEGTQICGADWVSPNNKKYMNNAPNYKATVEEAVNSYIDNGQYMNLSQDNKTYREWYYGGVEVEDNVQDVAASGEAGGIAGQICYDVTQPKVSGGNYPRQKYYMKGLETGNFNCKKYYVLPGQKDPSNPSQVMSATRLAEFRQAYDCCKRRSREYVCIDYNPKVWNPIGAADRERVFCQVGGKCNIKGIYFSAKSLDNGRLACAETFSLCPYNFAIGGGTDKCDFYKDGIYNDSSGNYTMITMADVSAGNCSNKSEIRNSDCTYNDKAGRCKNYCQYMAHCTKTDLSNYKYASEIKSPFFATACMNFVGDSRNQIAYGTGFIAGSARHFSAPIAQCVKETLENVFYNRAGHTQCYVYGDVPGSNGECANGTDYKKGELVPSESFFAKLQRYMEAVVKMVLTLSIVFYGFKLLTIGKDGINKKDIVMYLLKIGLVMYFATGNAWQGMFFDGVYGASTVFSQMVFKIQTSNDLAKRDGCQFGQITLEDGTPISSATSYPSGKEYLAIWDTLDCKIARYMGFGPEVSTANIVKLIIAGFFTFGFGIYFSVALLIFGMVLISATLRALHIFLSSSIAILLMVYVSPLIIPLSLFKTGEKIFKGWLSNLVSFCFQPIILFAYLGIFIAAMDRTLIGSATFYGEPPTRTISCRQYCQNAQGSKVMDSPNCDRIGEKIIRPKVDSVACMIDAKGFSNWPGLELVGVAIPFLLDFADHTREKIITIIKAALIMYFLFEFMDQVPDISSYLIGGTTLTKKGDVMSAKQMFAGTKDFLKSAQERGKRGATKAAIAGGKGAMKMKRDAMNEIGNKGKKVDESGGSGGSNNVGKSDSGADGGGGGGGGGGGAGNSSGGGDN